MEKTDKRKIGAAAQYELRRQVVRLKSGGRESKEIAEITGLSHQAVNSIWRNYLRGGLAAMKIKARGRKPGTKRRLSCEREQELRRLMIDKTPDQLSFKFSLWSRAAVREVVLKRFKVDLPLRTISDYMKRFGFSPQKPRKRAYEQNPKAVKEWLEKVYPAIAEQSRLEGGEIYWGDETGVEAGEYDARGYAPRGRTPTVRMSANTKASRLNMISAITNQGQVRFMIYEEKMTSAVFIKFMGRLIRDSKAKIFLIVDNLRVHHSQTVRDWLSVEDRRSRLEVFYLPSYSPELNPDEHLNSDLKGQTRSGLVAHTKEEVKHKVRSAMKIIQNNPERVKKYFHDPVIAYAA